MTFGYCHGLTTLQALDQGLSYTVPVEGFCFPSPSRSHLIASQTACFAFIRELGWCCLWWPATSSVLSSKISPIHGLSHEHLQIAHRLILPSSDMMDNDLFTTYRHPRLRRGRGDSQTYRRDYKTHSYGPRCLDGMCRLYGSKPLCPFRPFKPFRPLRAQLLKPVIHRRVGVFSICAHDNLSR